MKTTYGTSYFPTRGNAIRYYRDYEGTDAAAAVDRKIAAGEIHIGKPPTKPGDVLSIRDNRYHVTEGVGVVHSRADYMAGKVSHSEYYGQFVGEGIKQRVIAGIGAARIKASNDKNMNDIPLKEWDALLSGAPKSVAELMRAAGDYPTAAGLVCIAKEAARQIKDESAT